MIGFRFGVWVAGVCSGFALWSWPELAHAQSTASFPEPAGAPPRAEAPRALTPPPVAATPPSVNAPTPVVPTTPTTNVDSTTDSRYPVLQSPTLPNATALPSSSRLGFYPAVLPYHDGLPVPAGYRVEHRSANGLIAGGLATLFVAYGAALAVGLGDGFKNGTGWVVVPVVGPWAAIGARSFHCTNDPLQANACVNDAFSEVQTIAILSADAVVQATGAVLFFAGLASGEDELVRSDLQTGVRVTPRAVGTNGFGIGVDGRF
jgi:hypothetical protein